jgi:hypothetical protein
MATDPTEFLRARLAEDETAAKAALPGPWMTGRVADHLVGNVVYGQSRDWPGHIVQVCNVDYGHNKAADSEHIVRHDPARVQRETEAKRRIMERHYANEDGMCEGCPTSEITLDPQIEISECPELRDLAAIYSDHPDYRQEWAS